ncbi:sodium:proton antiporter NhaD [Candidatus Endoriftia persephonae]|nr:sodium:proton antiporter NhaD [Candidatus Endoriftia persephone]USF88432.1 sodium:proton antiporter NhaD [Candidatus Endoriftia persephone]
MRFNAVPITLAVISLLPLAVHASTPVHSTATPTFDWPSWLALIIFCGAMLLAILEEKTDLHKSKPLLLAAGLIWALIAWHYQGNPQMPDAESVVRNHLLQFAELMLFLLVVMTYINAMNERRLFLALHHWMVFKGFSYRQLFWLSGAISFFASPFLDNLSTPLLVGTAILTLAREHNRFVGLACINIVVATNAGGVFTPSGDLSTLMVWQHRILTPQGMLDFPNLLSLALPALLAWLVPTLLMHPFVPRGRLPQQHPEPCLRRGAFIVLLLLLATIATGITFAHYLDLPAAIGMMTGLAYLQFYGYYLKRTHQLPEHNGDLQSGPIDSPDPFDFFHGVARSQWDSLLFLAGLVLCIGGLAHLGWLASAESLLYGNFGPTTANIMIGLYSAAIENITTMLGVLAMEPQMSLGQWQLITLTTGTGGSLLAIGSVAGVVLMAQAGERYTFFSHLKWTPAIALGYFIAIAAHVWLNAALF